MAVKKKAAKKVAKKTTKKKAAGKSLKIQSKRAKAKKKTATAKRRKRRLTVKTAKLTRTIKKMRAVAKKALRSATKGMEMPRIPEKTYRKIDALLAKNADVANAIQAAVIDAANELGTVKARKSRKKKAAPAEATEE